MATFKIEGHRNLTLGLKVNGRTRWVNFTFPVIYGNRGDSTFTTNDPKLIEALKKHKDFGVLFYLEEGVDVVDNTEPVSNTKPIEDDLTDPENAIIVDSVTTKGMAVAYIQGMFGENFTAKTVEDMKREAAKKWNVLFPKWGK